MKSLERFTTPATATIAEVMATIDRNAKGIAVVVDSENKLIATITDGDIRRALLGGSGIETPICQILDRPRRPITARRGSPSTELLGLMRSHGIRHVVLVDSDDRVVDLVTLDELVPFNSVAVEAVVMAGGRGRRLMPLTDTLPKPMLPIGGRPMLEWIIDGLRRSGIARITITSHYKAETIRRYFGNGWRFGVAITHLYEEKPSGTAGSLRLLQDWDHTILVMNGDILTWVDYSAMVAFHQQRRADVTVAVRRHEFQVPYGVVDMDGSRIRRLSEKPHLPCHVNAGIYLLEPGIKELLGDSASLDMTQLIAKALDAGKVVEGFPITEYWTDIGQAEDYQRAQEHVDAQLAGVPA